MLEVMLALGAYRFSLSTSAYQVLERSADWRWPQHDLIGKTPSRQYVGPGRQYMKLEGLILPHYKGLLGLPNLLSRAPEVAEVLGHIRSIQSILQRTDIDIPGMEDSPGKWQIDALRQDANKGTPMLMIDGRGRDWGYWVVENMAERESRHMSHGAPLRVEFGITIGYYGEDPPGAGDGGSGLMDILQGIIGYL